MKKKIALLILVVLALTATLAACGNTAVTKNVPRWSDKGESYEYTVTLSDFGGIDSTTRFNSYNVNNELYYKDFLVRTGEPFDSLDEVRPYSVTGKYTLEISTSKIDSIEYDKVVTHQELTVSYEYKDGKVNKTTYGFSGGKIAKTREVSIELPEALKNIGTVSQNGDVTLITFTSTTDTMVQFKRDGDGKQAPRESWTKVDGFYNGEINQEKSDYEISTQYDYSGKRPVAKISLTYLDNETQQIKTEEKEDTLNRYSEGTFIDSNQLFIYTRSYDKSATSFQNSASVAVYNPFNQTMQAATFTWASTTAYTNTMLTNGEETLFVKLPTVGVVVDGIPLLVQASAPNMLDENKKGADRVNFAEDVFAKHTPVRFRVGYLSFELAEYSSELWEGLRATTVNAE